MRIREENQTTINNNQTCQLEEVNLVTAPIDRPQRPIQDICLLLLKYDTAILRSSFCHKKDSEQIEYKN